MALFKSSIQIGRYLKLNENLAASQAAELSQSFYKN